MCISGIDGLAAYAGRGISRMVQCVWGKASSIHMAENGRETHTLICMAASSNLSGRIFSENLIPKLQDMNTWKEDFSKREFSTHFYCLDNVSTGNITEITVVEKEAIPTLFYHLGILQFIEVSYFSSEEKYEQQQKYWRKYVLII